MLTFTTEEGSTFSVDVDAKTIVQVSGPVRSDRIAAGRKFRHLIGSLVVGGRVLVIWEEDTPPLNDPEEGEVRVPATLISPIVSIAGAFLNGRG